MRRVFVLGKNGYIGSKLISYLQANRPEFEVTGIGRGEDCLFNYWSKDSTDVVVNCAGVGVKPGTNDPERYLYDNTVLPWNISKTLNTTKGGARLIHLSSYFQYFTNNLYAKSKALAAELIKDVPNVTNVVLYNVFGYLEYPNRIMAGVKNAVKNEKVFILTNPAAVRSFVHLDHVLRGISEVIDGADRSELHFTNGTKTTMSAFIDDIHQECKKHNIPFDYTIRDSGGYTFDCYLPKTPYFTKKLPLYDDVVRDIKLYLE